MGGIAAKYYQHTASRFDTIGTAPEHRYTDVSETDPSGRYRWQGDADAMYFERAATAGWATSTRHIVIDENSGAFFIEFRGTSPEVRFAETNFKIREDFRSFVATKLV